MGTNCPCRRWVITDGKHVILNLGSDKEVINEYSFSLVKSQDGLQKLD